MKLFSQVTNLILLIPYSGDIVCSKLERLLFRCLSVTTLLTRGDLRHYWSFFGVFKLITTLMHFLGFFWCAFQIQRCRATCNPQLPFHFNQSLFPLRHSTLQAQTLLSRRNDSKYFSRHPYACKATFVLQCTYFTARSTGFNFLRSRNTLESQSYSSFSTITSGLKPSWRSSCSRQPPLGAVSSTSAISVDRKAHLSAILGIPFMSELSSLKQRTVNSAKFNHIHLVASSFQ